MSERRDFIYLLRPIRFRCDSEEAAAEFMRSDPAVQGGVMTAELHSFRVSLWAGPLEA